MIARRDDPSGRENAVFVRVSQSPQSLRGDRILVTSGTVSRLIFRKREYQHGQTDLVRYRGGWWANLYLPFPQEPINHPRVRRSICELTDLEFKFVRVEREVGPSSRFASASHFVRPPSRHLEVTKLASTGGFLREGNTTLLIGVDDDKLEIAKDVIREKCRSRTRFVTPGVPVAEQPEPFLAQPVEVPVGGAVAFVLNVEEFFKV
jgi:uncharacterized protein YaaQ